MKFAQQSSILLILASGFIWTLQTDVLSGPNNAPSLHGGHPNSLPGCEFDHHPNTADLCGTSYVNLVKSIRLSEGTTYRYVFIEPDSKRKPYLLFLHGFPSSSFDWRHQIDYFRLRGYGVIAPDLLGYGGTDKPKDLESYRLRRMAHDIIEILDCEGIEMVYGVGHDFGSPLLSRLLNYHSLRFEAAVFIDIGYFAPPLALNVTDIEAINNKTAQDLGYSIFGYWLLFNEPYAAHIMDAHLESAWSMFYTSNESIWKTDFGPVGRLRQWLLEDKKATWGVWVTQQDMLTHNRIISSNGGYGPLLNWYKSVMNDFNAADELSIPQSATVIQAPVLLLTASNDPIGLANSSIQSTQPYAPNFRTQSIASGHFIQLEQSLKTNEYLEDFFTQVSRNKSGQQQ